MESGVTPVDSGNSRDFQKRVSFGGVGPNSPASIAARRALAGELSTSPSPATDSSLFQGAGGERGGRSGSSSSPLRPPRNSQSLSMSSSPMKGDASWPSPSPNIQTGTPTCYVHTPNTYA